MANVAKYRDGQPVLGATPASDLYGDVLVRRRIERLGTLPYATG